MSGLTGSSSLAGVQVNTVSAPAKGSRVEQEIAGLRVGLDALDADIAGLFGVFGSVLAPSQYPKGVGESEGEETSLLVSTLLQLQYTVQHARDNVAELKGRSQL